MINYKKERFMVKFIFEVEQPEDYEFYSDTNLSFGGIDLTVTDMFARFEQFLLGMGYDKRSIQKFYDANSSVVKEKRPVQGENFDGPEGKACSCENGRA
jgi:hypothetical protein